MHQRPNQKNNNKGKGKADDQPTVYTRGRARGGRSMAVVIRPVDEASPPRRTFVPTPTWVETPPTEPQPQQLEDEGTEETQSEGEPLITARSSVGQASTPPSAEDADDNWVIDDEGRRRIEPLGDS